MLHKRIRGKIIKTINKYKVYIIIGCILLLFPVGIAFLHKYIICKFLDIKVGDLLGFYGVAMGIFSSYVTYSSKQYKKKLERENEMRPKILIEMQKLPESENVFDLTIHNQSKRNLSCLYLYDEYISQVIPKEKKLKIAYNANSEEMSDLNIDGNITIDSNILGKHGYPTYVQIMCNDEDGNLWSIDFESIAEGEKVYYLGTCSII